MASDPLGIHRSVRVLVHAAWRCGAGLLPPGRRALAFAVPAKSHTRYAAGADRARVPAGSGLSALLTARRLRCARGCEAWGTVSHDCRRGRPARYRHRVRETRHRRVRQEPRLVLSALETLDEVCARLLSAGPLNADRQDLWWKLVGTYVGEVVLAAYTETVSALRTFLPQSLRSHRDGRRRGQMSRAAGGTA